MGGGRRKNSPGVSFPGLEKSAMSAWSISTIFLSAMFPDKLLVSPLPASSSSYSFWLR